MTVELPTPVETEDSVAPDVDPAGIVELAKPVEKIGTVELAVEEPAGTVEPVESGGTVDSDGPVEIACIVELEVDPAGIVELAGMVDEELARSVDTGTVTWGCGNVNCPPSSSEKEKIKSVSISVNYIFVLLTKFKFLTHFPFKKVTIYFKF